ncbi:enoyl-CoA hydratase [Kocuria polaris]|nr:enoyl-CoA hydratase [Kocuria polaris]
MGELAAAPPEFVQALTALRRAAPRSEVALEEIPAPAKLAPYGVALSADVVEKTPLAQRPAHGPAAAFFHTPSEEAAELATGRFILLYDPAGSPVWDGRFRVVTYIRAELDAQMGNDQMLGTVAWTWLSDALEEHRARFSNAGGTATRVLSESFGTLAERPETIDIELRASWTPAGPDVTAHLEAWADMVCAFAGLPPLPEGVTALPRRRLT